MTFLTCFSVIHETVSVVESNPEFSMVNLKNQNNLKV